MFAIAAGAGLAFGEQGTEAETLSLGIVSQVHRDEISKHFDEFAGYVARNVHGDSKAVGKVVVVSSPQRLAELLRKGEVDFYMESSYPTYVINDTHGAGKLLHLTAMFADPTSPPLPSGHPLSAMMGQLGVKDPRRGHYDESEITALYDRLIGEGDDNDRIKLSSLEKIVAEEQDPMHRLAIQLHRARRFYERPESKRAYRERPELELKWIKAHVGFRWNEYADELANRGRERG